MTRKDAEVFARELAAGDPAHGYFPRERDGEWQVVKVPGLSRHARPTGTAIQARPRPEADDARTPEQRSIPPFGPMF